MDKYPADDRSPWVRPFFGGKERDYLLRALDSTWIERAEFVDKVESNFADLIGTRYVVNRGGKGHIHD